MLLPFFGWAIVLLRRRFVYYEENSLGLEAGTVAALALFFWIEASALRYALGNQTLLYFFAVLGISVAAFALYGHVMISLASRVVVDLVVPGDESATLQPRFGPVDALERSEDFEGALHEYLVLARIYPRNFEVLQRTARIQEILGNPEEAATWYLRARKRAANAAEALAAVNRLCALYDAELDRPDEAGNQLAQFIEDFPESPDRLLVVDRLERREHKTEHSVSVILQALDESPLEQAPEVTVAQSSLPAAGPPLPWKPEAELVTLDEAGAVESRGNTIAPAKPRSIPDSIFLDHLESMGVSGRSANGPSGSGSRRADTPESPGQKKSDAPRKNGDSDNHKPVLEPLETAKPSPEPAADVVPERQKRPKISLEAMDGDDA